MDSAIRFLLLRPAVLFWDAKNRDPFAADVYRVDQGSDEYLLIILVHEPPWPFGHTLASRCHLTVIGNFCGFRILCHFDNSSKMKDNQ
jgi:hypothetical protein